MATPAQTLQVNVNFDATKNAITFSGDCDANGNIQVYVGWVNTIDFTVVTSDPPIPAAVMQGMGLPVEPTWLSSNPQPQGQDPAWILTAEGGAKGNSALYTVYVGLPGQVPARLDPTIVNVDPPQMPEVVPAPERRSELAAAG